MVRVVHGLIHAHEFRCQVEEQGRFQFSAALVFRATFDEIPHVDGHQVHDFDRQGACESG